MNEREYQKSAVRKKAINRPNIWDKLKSYRKHPGAFLLLLLVCAAAVITAVTLLFLVGYVLVTGVPNLKPSLFAWKYNSDNVSMVPAIINTIEMVLMALFVAVPLGVGAAI